MIPKRGIKAAWLAGRRGVRWPLAWAAARRAWSGIPWDVAAGAWNAGRDAAGLDRVELV